jgi:hypothetical protein
VLRKVSLPIRVEVAGGWRILRSEALHDLSSSDLVVKSSSVRWAGNVTSMEVRSSVWDVLVGKRKILENLGANVILILKWMLWKYFGGRELQ